MVLFSLYEGTREERKYMGITIAFKSYHLCGVTSITDVTRSDLRAPFPASGRRELSFLYQEKINYL
jgi:hypothetical protein